MGGLRPIPRSHIAMEGASVQELITQAGARVHLERERALGRIEELLDGAGEPRCLA